jgi:hypothetical protein
MIAEIERLDSDWQTWAQFDLGTRKAVHTLIDADGNRVFEFEHFLWGIEQSWNDDSRWFIAFDESWAEAQAIFDGAGNWIERLGSRFLGGGFFSETDPPLGENLITVRGNGFEAVRDDIRVEWTLGDWFFVYGRDDGVYMWNIRTGEEREERLHVDWWWRQRNNHMPDDLYLIRKFSDHRSHGHWHWHGVADGEFNMVIDLIYSEIIPVLGYYMVQQGNFGGLIDADGEWVIKVPLFGNSD